jgi:glycosyltransferase involved in cell wall biosynthesis
MASELTTRGHEVTVLTSVGSARDNGRPQPTTFSVRRELELEVQGGLLRTLVRIWDRKALSLRSANAVRRTISATEPDAAVIWGMWNLSRSVPATVERLMPARTVYYLGDYWPALESAYVQQLSNPARHKLAANTKRMLAAPLLKMLRDDRPAGLCCDHAVCCSHYLRDHLVDKGLLPPAAGVIYGGVDYSSFARIEQGPLTGSSVPKRLVYVGRVVPEKGVRTAIDALAILSGQPDTPAFELDVVGTGPEEYVSELRYTVRSAGLEQRVRFSGHLDSSEIPNVLKRSDICLFTSTWPEPFGRTIVEAMSAGVVVLGTNVGGSREIFERYDVNVTFPPGDAGTLAARIMEVVKDPERREQLRKKGRRLGRRLFNTVKMADRLEDYLSQIARQGR